MAPETVASVREAPAIAVVASKSTSVTKKVSTEKEKPKAAGAGSEEAEVINENEKSTGELDDLVSCTPFAHLVMRLFEKVRVIPCLDTLAAPNCWSWCRTLTLLRIKKKKKKHHGFSLDTRLLVSLNRRCSARLQTKSYTHSRKAFLTIGKIHRRWNKRIACE